MEFIKSSRFKELKSRTGSWGCWLLMELVLPIFDGVVVGLDGVLMDMKA
jgi:hypothetical protein